MAEMEPEQAARHPEATDWNTKEMAASLEAKTHLDADDEALLLIEKQARLRRAAQAKRLLAVMHGEISRLCGCYFASLARPAECC